MQENQKDIINSLRVAVAAVDVVVFTIIDGKLKLFLTPINRPPYFENVPGLPGSTIRVDENATQTATRIMKERMKIDHNYFEQIYAFTDVDRDPRSRSISIAYLALIKDENMNLTWQDSECLGTLAFDHNRIVKKSLEYLKTRIKTSTLINQIMPDKFTLAELQQYNEIILNSDLDKRNFRKKIKEVDVLKSVGKQVNTSHRPAELYSFKSKEVLDIDML